MKNPMTSVAPQIEFTADWSNLIPFSDVGSIAKVDHPQAMNEWFSSGLTGGAEKTVGKLDMVEASLMQALAQHSRAVCRITVPPGQVEYTGRTSMTGWYGTGFLVAPNILLTNYHVLNTETVAAAAVAEFDYQVLLPDLMDGAPDTAPSAKSFKLMPERLFIESKFGELDYAFVWIEDEAAAQFGTIQMNRGSFLTRATEPTFVLHHPGGAPKKASVDDTEVLSINSSFVLYAADTTSGSSGAPVIDRRGRLTALHHAWWPIQQIKSRFPMLTGRLNDGSITPIANEGIKLSAIAIDLEARMMRGGVQGRAAAKVLDAFGGSDSMTGMFGSLGRHTDAQEDTGGYERVVQVYQGRDQDIDIGSWNIEWFNRDYTDQRRLERVATVISDLGLDVWALSEVSPDAVNALLEVLKTTFQQNFEAAFSEPDASNGKQSTAVIWRPNVVNCTPEAWPDELDEMFRADSRDDDLPFEAAHGKIFNRYPGLFRMSLNSTDKDFDFYLVPLHLKARSEGSLRREMASKALTYAVDQMVKTHGKDSDWIILGDVNATLKSSDLDPLLSGGFKALGAADEENGAFTYLKSPYNSMIDNIFVSDSMSGVADEGDFFIIETDRSVSRFVRDVSDHRPIALRLSLADLPNVQTNGPVERKDAQSLFDALLSRMGVVPPSGADPVPNTVAGWDWERYDKVDFFRVNRPQFDATIAQVNRQLAQKHGSTYQPLTVTDVAVVYMAEAAVKQGLVDPRFVHSNGEHGLFPLPSNIEFWLGRRAPAYNRPMSIDDNITTYLAYLGALRNKGVKTVSGRRLYPDLFKTLGIAGSTHREAKLLAGIVHGYFFSGNYASARVPFDQILSGFAVDEPIDQIMSGTGYVHEGSRILRNRQRNIDQALVELFPARLFL